MIKINKITAGSFWIKYAASLLVHILLFFIVAFFLEMTLGNEELRSPYVQVSTGRFTKAKELTEEPEKTEEIISEETKTEEPEEKEERNVSYFYSPEGNNFDTTGLRNIYSEKTLNVRIKYPAGWNFIDANVKRKLDGVTFWGLTDIYDPPPYIHLEVKEKYLFNPSRYKYSEEFEDYTIYYNDPEETADQYTQIIYIRTEDDEDYSLKLIMKGKESFKTFQPVFFGMLKTFKFG